MAFFRCKMCGANIEIDGHSMVVTCDHCDSVQTIPAIFNDEKKRSLFNIANSKFFKQEFDRAYGNYENIISEYPNEAEAYWGLCLCKYGIEYVTDPATGKKIPTCHRTNSVSIFDDDDFKDVCKYAGDDAKEQYIAEAKEIDRLQKRILEVASKEEPYDIFISYKEADPVTGERTQDSIFAQELYTMLCEKGYRVFYSRITLQKIGGMEYEPYIYAALTSAKFMIVLGTSLEYLNAVWVKNEWSRFSKMLDDHPEKALLVCHKNLDEYDLPSELRKKQALNIDTVTFTENLLNSISSVVSPKSQEEPVESNTVITQLRAYASNNGNDNFSDGVYLSEINLDAYRYVYIHFSFKYNTPPDTDRANCEVNICDSREISIFNATFDIENDYANYSAKYWQIKNDDSHVKEGVYTATLKVDDSKIKKYTFEIVSNKYLADQEKRLQMDFNSGNINVLLKRAGVLLSQERFSDAKKFYEKVLDINPENSYAYLGRLCISLKLNGYDQLRTVKESFESEANFKNALRFARGETKDFVQGILDDYKENIYQSALKIKEQAEKEYNIKLVNEAIDTFERVKFYKNSTLLIDQCTNFIQECRYVLAKKAAKSRPSKTIEYLSTLSDYKDSEDLIKKARMIVNLENKKMEFLKEHAELEKNYKTKTELAEKSLIKPILLLLCSIGFLILFFVAIFSFEENELGALGFLAFVLIANGVFVIFSDPFNSGVEDFICSFAGIMFLIPSIIVYPVFRLVRLIVLIARKSKYKKLASKQKELVVNMENQINAISHECQLILGDFEV